MSSIHPALGTLVLAAVIAALVATARGLRRTRRAARRTDGRQERATGLDRRFARLHYELLRARTELRVALAMPIDPGLDLRDGALAGEHPGLVRPHRRDTRSIAVARHRVQRLWRDGAPVLGSAQHPVWHVRGRLDWVRLGTVGRQVVTVRATLGHDPGRWITVRAVRRTRRGVPALGGGGSRLGGTIRAVDGTGLVRAVALAVAEPVARPVLGRAPRRRWRVLHDLRARMPARWELVSIEVLSASGPWDATSADVDRDRSAARGRATPSAVTARPRRGPLLNPGPQRPDHLDRKR